MSDLISRQAAIDAIWKPIIKPNEMIFDALKQAQQNEIETLPSVEPEQRVGHWIEHEWAQELDGEGYLISNFECDKCHAWAGADYDYCPNCGVKMEEKV